MLPYEPTYGQMNEEPEKILRREHIRVGYLDNQGHPVGVNTDEEADEQIRHELRTEDQGWRPCAMTREQCVAYNKRITSAVSRHSRMASSWPARRQG